mmetsp:Transcript_27260/g.55781  ORF Transcript_27260/g.55781 Transcript_27260/m.55781 type:complete len:592 (-) Transcript_27260:189-1964(-)
MISVIWILTILLTTRSFAFVPLHVTSPRSNAFVSLDSSTLESDAVDTASKFRPGEEDTDLFPTVLPSVAFWKRWQPTNALSAETDSSPRIVDENLLKSLANIRDAAATALGNGLKPGASAAAREYWAYHSGRLSFFTGQNLVALGLARLRLRREQEQRGLEGEDQQTSKKPSSFIFESNSLGPLVVALGNIVSEAVATWEQDFANIEAGYYKQPWDQDMGFSHRQASPRFVLGKARRLVEETYSILSRRSAAAAGSNQEPSPRSSERRMWLGPSTFTNAKEGAAAAPDSMRSPSNLYPDYYQTDFHYQTDGWMSESSAKVYETATESLFMGRQDAMQRGALVPLSMWAHDQQKQPKDIRILEVACGTGRFATFVRDNYPQSDLTLVDLSPFYLEAARENMAYWEEARGATSVNNSPSLLEKNKGGFGGGVLGAVTFEQGKAEALPFDDDSFDALLCVYLFHELPSTVRKQVAAEFARVLKPGGVVCVVDSVQRGDRLRSMDDRLDRFTDLNEPFFASYAREDLAGLFTSAGLTPFLKGVTSVSKTVAFEKPRTNNAADDATVAAAEVAAAAVTAPAAHTTNHADSAILEPT